MKILNLYSGIGGNRKLWKNVEVTAVEMNEEIAAIYKEYFPDDKMIIADAHEYLLKHYKEFDFIWSSRSCITHSKARFWASMFFDFTIMVFREYDERLLSLLYEVIKHKDEVIDFLQGLFNADVENALKK